MRTLILCNGEAPPPALFNEARAWAQLFIAADGGGNIAHRMEARPDVIIGDMDSYEPRENASVEVIHQPDQETNDLEKALALARDRGGRSVQVLAATGQRLDHTLKNLSVLKQFNEHFEDIIFSDAHGTTRLLPRSFTREIAPGTPVSLFPLSGKVTGISTRGLQYALADAFLQNGIRDGSSNRVTASPVHIEHRSGDLLMFIANAK